MGTEPSEQCGSRFSTKCRVNKNWSAFQEIREGAEKNKSLE